jgi:transposase InsO family protein
VAERWIVGAAATSAGEACVELRLRECDDARRQNAADADADRRIHPGVPGDPCGQKAWRYEVIEALADVMLFRGIPENIRSDNGPFVAKELREWLAKVGTGTLYIEPGSPWENCYCESFNGKLRDECSNVEIFYALKEAQIVIEKWPLGSKSTFTAHGCDIKSLTSPGLANQAGQS